MYSVFGWRNAYEQHRDYAERYGVVNAGPAGPACVGCHSMTKTVSAMGAPGCQTCHGPKFCGTPGSNTLPECSSKSGSSGSYGGSSSGGSSSGGMSTPTGTMYAVFGWRNAYEQHRDYAERYGVVNAGPAGPACIGCHSMTKTMSAMGAPGCQTCHGPKFCGTPGSSSIPECGSRSGSSGSSRRR